MNEKSNKTISAERYDKALLRGLALSPVPDYCPVPQPSSNWPEENIELLERFRIWLEGLGVSPAVIKQHRIPMAGHVLGLALKPHSQLDLETDLEQAMTYVEAKQLSAAWTNNCRHSLNWFRRFLMQERGLVEFAVEPAYKNAERFQAGLPEWLLQQLELLLHVRQANWRPSRRAVTTYQFWYRYTRVWHWLMATGEVSEPADIKRRHIHGYIDEVLVSGRAVKSVNQDLRVFQATLHFLEERGYLVPQNLLRMQGLKEPDSLPRFLTDEQVCKVRDDLEQRARDARTPGRIRDSRLDLAAFYLLWQGGLRLGELEDLCLKDLDFKQRRIMVRLGKGMKDRTVYLTDAALLALKDYLALRGPGLTENVFLYRFKPSSKDLIRNRLRASGQRVGVKVTPHMLRHTFATQLVNAGCKITTIQRLLGHHRLHSTLIYAKVHNKTVADDYYEAMALIEEQLEPHLQTPDELQVGSNGENPKTDIQWLLTRISTLKDEPLTEAQQAVVTELQHGLKTLSVSLKEEEFQRYLAVKEQDLYPQMLVGEQS